MSPRRILLVLSLLVAVATGFRACQTHSALRSVPGSEVVTVQQRELGSGFEEFGILEPTVIGRVLAPFRGTVSWMATDGLSVTNGTRLFLVDDDSISDSLEQKEEELLQTREQLQTLREDAEVLRNTYAAQHEQEKEEHDFAELELQTALDGMKASDRELTEIQIQQARIAVEDAQTLYDRQQTLVDKNFASALTLEPKERALFSAKALLQEQELEYRLAREPIAEEQRLTLEAKVKKARQVVERSREKFERQLTRKQIEIEEQESKQRYTEQELERLRLRLSRAEVLAPTNGVFRVIRQINRAAGNWQKLSTGLSVQGQNIIGEIIDPDEMRIESIVHESDAVHLTPGMPVSIQLTAYPEAVLGGTLLRSTSLAQDRSDLTPVYRKIPASRQAMFKAVIQFDAGELDIRPGMSARVRFQIDPVRPRLVLPRDVVHLRGETHEVLTTQRERKAVEGHVREDGWFEIHSGLRLGDKVLRVREVRDD